MKFRTQGLAELLLVAALTGCAAEAPPAATTSADATGVIRSREDAHDEREMRASGWDRTRDGIYYRGVDACAGDCPIEFTAEAGCPAGITVRGTLLPVFGPPQLFVVTTSPARGGEVVTLDVGARGDVESVESARCADL